MSEKVSAKASRRAAEEQARKDRKRYNTIVISITAVVVAVVLFVVLFSSNLFYNTTTAVSIGDMDFTVADFNYNYFAVYNNLYNSYGSYAQYVLPTSGSLRDTAYMGDETQTWADYLEGEAIDRMTEIAALCSEAEKAGYTLPQEEIDTVDATIAEMKSQLEASGSDFKLYLTSYYGKGMTEKVLRENMLRDALVSSYSQAKTDSFTYTQEELSAHYAENAADYDVFTYRVYPIPANAVEDDAETEEDETVTAEEALAQAKADADAFLAAVKSEQDFMDYAASLNADDDSYDADTATLAQSQGANISDPVKSWLVEPIRQEGNTAVLKTDDDASSQSYYVVYFIGRDDNQYPSVNGYFGLVAEDTTLSEDDFDSHEAYHEALRSTAEGDAGLVLADYEALAEKGYDAFVQLMTDSADLVSSSGAVDRAGKYDMPDEVSAWFYDASRTEGDTASVYVEGYGSYLLYYSGQGDTYANVLADTALRGDAYTAWLDGVKAAMTVSKGWEMGLSKRITALGG